MIVNVIDRGISSRDRIRNQEYQKHKHIMFFKRMIPDACGEVATIVKNYYTHKKNNPDTKIPYVKNHSIHLGRDNFKIEDGVFSFTVIPYGSKTSIKLCQYIIDMLKKYEIRSATITPTKLIITYCQTTDPDVQKPQKTVNKKFTKAQKRSKQKSVKKLPGKTVSIRGKKFTEYCADRDALKKTITVPKRKSSNKTKKEQDRDIVKNLGRLVAFDRNFRSLDGYDINGNIIKYDTSEILDIWNWVRSIMSKFNRKDRRMMKKISRKYNKLGRDKVVAIINRITRDIADNCDIVILEDLTKLHELWNKEKGKGSDANFNGKNWMYGEFSRQIEYKMKWRGKAVIY